MIQENTIIFLRAMLCDGPEPAQEIISRGIQAGFLLSQLKAAKKADGIKSVPEYRENGKIKKWWWV